MNQKKKLPKLSHDQSLLPRNRKASFMKFDKIPEEFYHDYSQQLSRLIPEIKRTRRPFQNFDFFNTSQTEPQRIILKGRHSYLFPNSMRKKFSQSYGSPEKAQQVRETILRYFNAYFFSSNSIREIDLSKIDGERIFTGEVDLLLSALKESLRRYSSHLSSSPCLDDSPNCRGMPLPQPHTQPSPFPRDLQTPFHNHCHCSPILLTTMESPPNPYHDHPWEADAHSMMSSESFTSDGSLLPDYDFSWDFSHCLQSPGQHHSTVRQVLSSAASSSTDLLTGLDDDFNFFLFDDT
jgi:hypothetical protein